MTKSKLTSSQKKNINRILVIQTAFIGDVILITPMLRELRKLYLKADIDAMVIPQTGDLLNNNPNLTNVILFDKKRNKLFSFFKTLVILRRNKYDIAISPHSSTTTALLLFFAGIPIRVGFARWFAQVFLTHSMQHIKNTFKIKKNLHLLSVLTDKELPMQTELFPTAEMESNAEILLSELKENKKYIAVAPGSNWFTKRWPLEYYEKLVLNLADHGFNIVFIGSEAERNICEQIKPSHSAINLAGRLSLLESAAVIKKCDLMICNDSGAMHIANAVKTDVFAFFGPTVKRIGYFPIGADDFVFEIDLDCRPCSSHGSDKCPLEHFNCMKKIEPEYVAKSVYQKFDLL